jgi:hypothetical protein
MTEELQQALLAFWHKWWDDTGTCDLTGLPHCDGYSGIAIKDAQELDDMAEKIQYVLDPDWFKK